MNIVTKKAVAKVAAVATGLGMATSLLSLAPMAHAAGLTADQITQIVNLLKAFGADATTVANVQASLNGQATTGTSSTGSMASSCAFTMDLHMGSSGAEVTCLQQALIAGGYSIPAGATGYFGGQTQAAVMAWQTHAGITPAAGYFGPKSRAAWSMIPAPGPNPNPGPVTLTGTGRLANVSGSGDISSDLKEGDKSTAVVGITGDVRDGDVQIQRVDAEFDLSGSAGSTNLNKYVSSVDLYVNGTKVASMDPADGDKNSDVWTYRFTNLGSDAVIKKGDTADISVHVTPVSSIGQNEDGETVTATIPTDGVRAIDANGISDTYVTSDESQDFTVSSATTGKLTIAESSSNPDDTTVKVDDSNTTTGVPLMSADLKAKNQDLTITDFPVQVCDTTAGQVSDVVQTVKLYQGSTVLKSKSLSSTGGKCRTVVFDSIDKSLSKDSTDTYTVKADLKSENGGANYSDAEQLVASTTVDLAWDVSDANGDTADLGGGALGGTMTLQTTGVTVTLGTLSSPDPVVTPHQGASDTLTATIPFTITAGDDAIWISKTVASSTTLGSGAVAGDVTWDAADGTTAALSSGSGAVTADGTTNNDSATGYKIAAGASRTFTLTVTGTAASTGLMGVKLVGFAYSTDSTVNGSDPSFTTGLSNFKTGLASITH